jgi:hypothetical protein
MHDAGLHRRAEDVYYSTRCANLIHRTANLAFKAEVKKVAGWGTSEGQVFREVHRRNRNAAIYHIIRRKLTCVPIKEVGKSAKRSGGSRMNSYK